MAKDLTDNKRALLNIKYPKLRLVLIKSNASMFRLYIAGHCKAVFSPVIRFHTQQEGGMAKSKYLTLEVEYIPLSILLLLLLLLLLVFRKNAILLQALCENVSRIMVRPEYIIVDTGLKSMAL